MASLTAVARRASSQLRRPQLSSPATWATGSTIQRRSFRSNDLPTFKSLQDEFELEDIEEFEGDDATALGHLILRQQREYLNLFRKIELEVPQLKGTRLTWNTRISRAKKPRLQLSDDRLSLLLQTSISPPDSSGMVERSIPPSGKPSSSSRFRNCRSPNLLPFTNSSCLPGHDGRESVQKTLGSLLENWSPLGRKASSRFPARTCPTMA